MSASYCRNIQLSCIMWDVQSKWRERLGTKPLPTKVSCAFIRVMMETVRVGVGLERMMRQ